MALKKGTAIVLLLIILIFLLIFIFKAEREMIDFQVNYVAGKRLRWAETLYRFEDGHYMFKYLPCSAFLYLPFSYLPLQAAKMVWYILIIICSVFIIFMSYRLLPHEDKPKYLLILPFLVNLRYFSRELLLGQINALVASILLVMTCCLVSEYEKSSHNKEIATGLLLGLAVALKPYALIFFPYLILKKKWRAFLSGVTFLGAALLAPAMFYGFHGNYLVLKEWYLTLSRSTPGLLSTLDNVSLISCFTKWTGNLKISFVFSAVLTSLLVLLVLSLILKGKGLPRAAVLECAISFMIIPLVSPLGWDYTMLMSTLGIMLILQNYSAYSRLGRIMLIVNLGLITFTIYDLLGKNLYTLLMQASVTTVNFLILIGYLSYLRTKRIC